MKYFFEAMQNDIEISKLDCEIECDRVFMDIQYQNRMNEFYRESTSDEMFMESSGKIVSALSKAIDAVIKFINDCVDKVRTIIASHQMKQAIKMYNDAVKKDPSLKDKKIEYKDYSKISEARDAAAKRLRHYKGDDVKGEIEKEQKKISDMKPKIVAITLGVAVAGLSTMAAVMYKKSKDRKAELEDLRSENNALQEKYDRLKTQIRKTLEEKKMRQHKATQANDEKERNISKIYDRIEDCYANVNYEYRDSCRVPYDKVKYYINQGDMKTLQIASRNIATLTDVIGCILSSHKASSEADASTLLSISNVVVDIAGRLKKQAIEDVRDSQHNR